jgi:cytochrome c
LGTLLKIKIFIQEILKMKLYSLNQVVRIKSRKFHSSQVLLFALLGLPELTNANPESLAEARNCFSCHKVEGNRIGPSYIEVSKKYSQDKNGMRKIIKQIQEGGAHHLGEMDLPPQPIVGTLSGFPTGNQWSKIPMPPQPQVNTEEAKQLADWILSLSKK